MRSAILAIEIDMVSALNDAHGAKAEPFRAGEQTRLSALCIPMAVIFQLNAVEVTIDELFQDCVIVSIRVPKFNALPIDWDQLHVAFLLSNIRTERHSPEEASPKY